ncbi:histidine kinase [Pedobacter sp. MC2016-05]|uniref:sensor histidine kinase n=1 Tax=Pedobacter sp. MC2016-05 TaxID=2994474 RepID=UPI0022454612|nr:histidine kinase [Pedobacter sp. MC2016-05]MCX2472844.1 histidine kinase [Pedobacter sp. MC2016-05]
MKQPFLYFCLAILLIFSCRQKPAGAKTEQLLKYKEEISLLSAKQPNKTNADSIVQAWKRYNSNPIVLADTDLNTKTKYNLGKMFARKNSDSSKMFLQQGLDLVEPGNKFLEIKANLYNGMGNLANAEPSEHQANYYYNKAAMIVLSDTTLTLKPMAKAIILLAAAQSNKSLQQYSLALKMNLAALKLMPQLPPNITNQQRVLTQLISLIYTANFPRKNVEAYLAKLEKLQATYPDDFNPRFLYDSKLLYFDKASNVDSVLKYSLLNAEIDEQIYGQNPTEPTAAGNIYTTYTNIVTNYVKAKNYPDAARYLKKANEVFKQSGRLLEYEDLIRGGEASSSYYAAIGQKDKALQTATEVIALQKENYEIENTQAVAEMGALYQIQAKDNSIERLNEDIKINTLKLERNKLTLVITALIILILLIVIFLFYSIYKQRKLKQEKENVQLQQQLLRTQMEPHFIFNTLSALQSFIRLDEKDEAIKYLNQFSRLLRSSLELSREKLVPLNQEIETLENYLSLQRMRYSNIFNFEINIPANEDLEMIMLPPMLIQPFVENSILHGINLNDKDGFVNVNFSIADQNLTVTITDSGKTISENKPQNHQSLSGIISKERLQLLGKERNQNAGITQNKTTTGGTVVSLNIPISQNESMGKY